MCTNPLKIVQNGEEYTVKCGKCDTCRREKAQDWAIKLINEAKYHKKACFITLTFDNKILLDKNSKARKKYGAHPKFVFNTEYSKEYFKKFIKRLRKKLEPKKITYFKVAEYGELNKRPHYHCIIFGENFEQDRKEMQVSKSGHIQYNSQILEELWACGRTSVQDINSNNIIYISQYAIKKYKKKDDQYKEKISFSNRSKMNIKWARRNYKEIIKGYIEDTDGKKYRVPESYKKMLKNSEEEIYKRTWRKYEENIMDRLNNISNNDLIKQQKIKEEIRRRRNDSKKRNF